MKVAGAFLCSGGNRLDFARQIAELQDSHVDLCARIVDVDSHEIPARVIVDDDAFGDFSTLVCSASSMYSESVSGK